MDTQTQAVPVQMLRVDEVAELLSMSRSAVYLLVMAGAERGGIASIRIGKSRRIPATAYAAFVARLQEEADRSS